MWQRKRETILILLWCLVVAFVVNPRWLGLPGTNLTNNATAIIALFLPLAVLNGQAATFLWDRIEAALADLAQRWGCPWRVKDILIGSLGILAASVLLRLPGQGANLVIGQLSVALPVASASLIPPILALLAGSGTEAIVRSHPWARAGRLRLLPKGR